MLQKIVLKIYVDGKNDYNRTKRKVMRVVCRISGVHSLMFDLTDEIMLTVIGDNDVDPLDVISKTKKIARTEILTVGPAKIWD